MLNSFTLNGPVPLTQATDFRSALMAALKSNPTLASLVGVRIFPLKIPETQQLPALRFSIGSDERGQNLDGPSGVTTARVKYGCKSKSYSDCIAIKEELRNLFDGSKNPLGTIQVLSVRTENEEDEYEDPPDDSDQGTYELVFDLLYRYREPKPTLS